MFDLVAVQQSLKEFRLDGWLFYDFRGANVLARRVLGLDQKPVGSRRFFYYVPATGQPRKLVHRIETAALDTLPGEKSIYLRWQDLEAGVAQLLDGSKRVAMEYAPRVSNPYVSRVDAGTIELVRSCGVEVVSSGDLIQRFEATWDDAQWQMHKDAEKVTTAAYEVAWDLIRDRVRSGGTIQETEVQSAIMDHFHSHGLTIDSPPIVGLVPHAGDPHYEPIKGKDAAIGKTTPAADLWAKLDRPRSVYSDLTRMGYVGDKVPEKYEKNFAVVAAARDALPAAKATLMPQAGRSTAGSVDAAGRAPGIDAMVTAPSSSTGSATTSARKSTATAPIWITSKRTTSDWCYGGRASPSSRGFTSTSSECAVKSMCLSTVMGRCT